VVDANASKLLGNRQATLIHGPGESTTRPAHGRVSVTSTVTPGTARVASCSCGARPGDSIWKRATVPFDPKRVSGVRPISRPSRRRGTRRIGPDGGRPEFTAAARRKANVKPGLASGLVESRSPRTFALGELEGVGLASRREGMVEWRLADEEIAIEELDGGRFTRNDEFRRRTCGVSGFLTPERIESSTTPTTAPVVRRTAAPMASQSFSPPPAPRTGPRRRKTNGRRAGVDVPRRRFVAPRGARPAGSGATAGAAGPASRWSARSRGAGGGCRVPHQRSLLGGGGRR
jgi:hypothetical protein